MSVIITGVLLLNYECFAHDEKGKVLPQGKPSEKEMKVPDVVATVNGVKIKGADFNKIFQNYKKRFAMVGQQFPEENIKEITKTLIEEMINRELLIQNSSKKGIKVSDDELKKEIESIKSKFPNENQFNQMMKSQNITIEDVKNDIKNVMIIKKFIKGEIENKILTDEKAISEYYKNNQSQFVESESVNASHILVKVDKNAGKEVRDAAKKKIDDLLKKIKKGEDFSKLAKENSDDSASGKNGGDLGFFKKGDMVPPFEKAAFSLNKGEISDVVETDFGYHIIKISDKKPGRTVPLSEVHDKLKNFLRSMEVNKKLSEYVASLRKTADIKTVEF
jgi:peptidyl-prolyl cis-trans isomerase C